MNENFLFRLATLAEVLLRQPLPAKVIDSLLKMHVVEHLRLHIDFVS
jgi:hypothetical protein